MLATYLQPKSILGKQNTGEAIFGTAMARN
jgi:hypothetical protein